VKLNLQTDNDTRNGNRSSCAGTNFPPSRSKHTHPARTLLLLPVAPNAAGTMSGTSRGSAMTGSSAAELQGISRGVSEDNTLQDRTDC
jgi:hypothetical protein